MTSSAFGLIAPAMFSSLPYGSSPGAQYSEGQGTCQRPQRRERAITVLTIENYFTPVSDSCEDFIEKRSERSKFWWHPYCGSRLPKPRKGVLNDNCRESGFSVPRVPREFSTRSRRRMEERSS